MSNAVPFRRSSARQWSLTAEAVIDFQDLLNGAPVLTTATAKPGVNDPGDVNSVGILNATGSSLSGIAFNLFELPAGAIVTGGDIKVLTAFNSATSDTFSLGDASSATRYASAVSLASAARTALTIPSRQAPATEKVVALWTGTGAVPTQGQVHVHLTYVIPGRAQENQGAE
jgi:hypothetical protein